MSSSSSSSSSSSLIRLSPLAAVLVAVVSATAAHGCGRTSLDDGFGPADGEAGTGVGGFHLTGAGGFGVGGTGVGGSGVGGARFGVGGSGAGGSSIISCGVSSCLLGQQSCCTRFANGQPILTCVAVSDMAPCNNGFIFCTSNLACPRALPICCSQVAQIGLGVCGLPGSSCTPLGP